MRMYQHLGLGLAGLATALSLNLIYPPSCNPHVRLEELYQISEDCSSRLGTLIENSSVRTCVEKKNIPGYADFLRLINYPGGFVESTLYHFIIDRAPEKK